MTGHVWLRSMAALSVLGGVLILACWLLAAVTPVPVLVPVTILFGLTRAESLVGTEVEVTGWYLRAPSPYVELRTVSPIGEAPGGTVRCWLFAARYLTSAAVLLISALMFAYVS